MSVCKNTVLRLEVMSFLPPSNRRNKRRVNKRLDSSAPWIHCNNWRFFVNSHGLYFISVCTGVSEESTVASAAKGNCTLCSSLSVATIAPAPVESHAAGMSKPVKDFALQTDPGVKLNWSYRILTGYMTQELTERLCQCTSEISSSEDCRVWWSAAAQSRNSSIRSFQVVVISKYVGT